MSEANPQQKRCPDCHEEVQPEARVCKWCGFRFASKPKRPQRPAGLEAGEEGLARERGDRLRAEYRRARDALEELALSQGFWKRRLRVLDQAARYLPQGAEPRLVAASGDLGVVVALDRALFFCETDPNPLIFEVPFSSIAKASSRRSGLYRSLNIDLVRPEPTSPFRHPAAPKVGSRGFHVPTIHPRRQVDRLADYINGRVGQ